MVQSLSPSRQSKLILFLEENTLTAATKSKYADIKTNQQQSIDALNSEMQHIKVYMKQLEAVVSAQSKQLKLISLELKNAISIQSSAATNELTKTQSHKMPAPVDEQLTQAPGINTQQPKIDESELAAREIEQEKQHFLDLDQSLGTQQIDLSWSQTMRQQLQNLEQRFSTMKLNGTEMASYDCRTTLCKVEWVHANDDEQQLAMNLFAVRGASGVSLQYINASDGNQRPRTIAYFNR